LEDRLVAATNETLFFHLTIGKLPQSVKRAMITGVRFARYRYLLQRIIDATKHQLSEPEEKIMMLKSSPAYQQWVTATEKGLGALSVIWKGKKLSITQASGMIQTLQKQSDRKRLHTLVIEQLKTLGLIAESEINAVITNKKLMINYADLVKPTRLRSLIITTHQKKSCP
jgi:oligoendopeptidase F